MNCIIFNALANTYTSSQNSPYSIVFILVIFALIFYFLVFRPQQKRNKIHKELMSAIGKDDEVLTVGGLVGRVVKITDTGYILVNLNEISEVVIKRDCVTAILPKGTMKSLFL